MIGLDLKRCIINICQGEVKEDEVDFIIFDLCHVKTDKEIRDVYSHFHTRGWDKYQHANAVLTILAKDNKIVYPGDHKVTTWPTPATAGSIWKLYSDELASQFGRGLKISKTLGNGIVAAPTFGKGVTVGKDAAGNTLGANGVPRRAAKRSARYPSGATAGGPVAVPTPIVVDNDGKPRV
jgi:hypothetical protein